MTQTAPARRGPKRSEESRLAILTAAFELTQEAGYRGLTIEGIAARAGVGKQTVYRWWPTKADVLLEAAAAKADLRVSTADQGSYRRDLERFLHDSFTLAAFPGLAGLLRSLMAEAQLDPDFAARFREGFLNRRRSALIEIVRRGRVRGDAPGEQPTELLADVVFGVIWYRLLATERPLDADDVDPLLDLLAPAGTRQRHP
ncbi:TetR/AcrR family transcriptional regulator [Microbacterium sp. SORGH_AS_0888]|uniref:TetR/AcrR family transcriptional regulator n=1 Tax=Microbacterium sp. SORGH_AS_0888 TaxID=3041791 RepID=UPI00278ADB2A|nr:TetR/AcrR family transcriptional regulator [Microbacterium sp. SORGH_AS_0888]MDQ1130416.1 AcrR family transcriptional regulator [Microbacterium sp. SORGH_AS_0888]